MNVYNGPFDTAYYNILINNACICKLRCQLYKMIQCTYSKLDKFSAKFKCAADNFICYFLTKWNAFTCNFVLVMPHLVLKHVDNNG